MKRFTDVLTVFLFLGIFTFNALSEETGNYLYYKIKTGDTLSEVALVLKVPTNELIKINPELGTRNIKPDQIIKYPPRDQKMELRKESALILAEIRTLWEEHRPMPRFNAIPKIPDEAKDRIYLILVAGCLIMAVSILMAVLIWRRKKKLNLKEIAKELLREIKEEEKPPEETIENITINGRKARMVVRRTPNGHFVSEVAKNTDGNERVFEKRASWLDSTKTILKRSPELVEKLEKAGSLRFLRFEK